MDNEVFQGQLERFCGGVSGCVCGCDGGLPADQGTGIRLAAVPLEPVASASQ